MLFTLEQNLIRETARDFAAHKIAPYAGAWETKGLNRKALLSELGRLGLMGIFVPTEWDGAGADFVSYVLATEEIAGADFRNLQHDERAQLAGLRGPQRIRHRKPEAALSSAARARRAVRSVSPDRAGSR